jgi:hypothetical protein
MATISGAILEVGGGYRAVQGTITADLQQLYGSATWNAGGVTFTALLLEITSTASAAASLLANFKVGGSSMWKVDKTGAVTQAAGLTVTTGGITVSAGTTSVQALTVSGLLKIGAPTNIGGASIAIANNKPFHVNNASGSTVFPSNYIDATDVWIGAQIVTGKSWRLLNSSGTAIFIFNDDQSFSTQYGLAISGTGDFTGVGGLSMSGILLMNTAVVTSATAGEIVLANAKKLRSANAAGSGTFALIGMNSSNQVDLSPDGQDIKWSKANVALGGGAAPTVGTIGGSGPAAAAQRNWLRFIESDGTASFIPVWR